MGFHFPLTLLKDFQGLQIAAILFLMIIKGEVTNLKLNISTILKLLTTIVS